MNSTSPTLLNRVKNRSDAAAWDRFVKLYTPLLFHCCCRLGLQEQEASDAVQDVFVLLLDKLPRFEYAPDRSFRAWLRTVTVNKCRERFRRQRELAAGGSGAGLSGVADVHDSEELWHAEYHQRLTVRALEIMQAEFEPATWRACWETAVENRPIADVATELGLTPGKVYVARSRVFRRLREELGDLLDD